MAERDPIQEPRFGDLFDFNDPATGDGGPVIYIAPAGGGAGVWTGLSLTRGDIADYVPLVEARHGRLWKFVETIGGHASGTPLFTGWDPATGGVSTVATLMLHHLDGDPTNNEPSNLRVEVLK